MCFYLKWCVKKKIQTNKKSQLRKTVCEIVNFGSTKLTKSKKQFLETKHFHNTFIFLLYIFFTCKEFRPQQL